MLERVKETVLVHQTNPKALLFAQAAASILESLLLGKNLKVSLEKVVEAAMSSKSNFSLDDSEVGDACLYALMEAKSKSFEEFIEGLVENEFEDTGGRTARFPAAFTIPMYIYYTNLAADVNEESYVKAIRDNIMAGGAVCLRSIFIGACMANYYL